MVSENDNLVKVIDLPMICHSYLFLRVFIREKAT